MQGFPSGVGEPPPPKPSGCSTVVLILVALLLVVGGAAFYWVARRSHEDPLAVAGVQSNSAATLGMLGVEGAHDDWDGTTTLECTGADHVTLSGRTVVATASPAIRATGGCTLALVGSTITAPVVLEATGAAHVTITGGTLVGSVRAIEATGAAHVDVAGATVTGRVSRSGAAVVTGLAK